MVYQSSLGNSKLETYEDGERVGVAILSSAAALSFLSLVFVLIMLAVSSIRYLRSGRASLLLHTNVIVYLVSLLLSNVCQAVGSILNFRWVLEKQVEAGPFCTAQGALKQFGNVATASWSLIIAIHVFNVLFLRLPSRLATLYLTVTFVWGFALAVILGGSYGIGDESYASYYGVAGYWCWITKEYPQARFWLEYFFMFFSSGVSLILYLLVWLRARGNLYGEGWKLKFRWVPASEGWRLQFHRDAVDAKMLKLTYKLLWYPLVYMFCFLPVAISRFIQWSGHDVPFQVMIASGTLFALNGFWNSILFFRTRSSLPTSGMLPALSIPRKVTTPEDGIDPFVLPPKEVDNDLSRQESHSSTSSRAALIR